MATQSQKPAKLEFKAAEKNEAARKTIKIHQERQKMKTARLRAARMERDSPLAATDLHHVRLKEASIKKQKR